jgi:CheY-like chemotaxis protein
MATVLIVDDEHTICEMLCELVTDLGHVGLSASNGRVALQLARVHHPDLILSDVMMPDLDGYGLAAALRAEPSLAQALIFLMSAAFRQGQPLHLVVEVNGLITKPFELPEIERLLRGLPA